MPLEVLSNRLSDRQLLIRTVQSKKALVIITCRVAALMVATLIFDGGNLHKSQDDKNMAPKKYQNYFARASVNLKKYWLCGIGRIAFGGIALQLRRTSWLAGFSRANRSRRRGCRAGRLHRKCATASSYTAVAKTAVKRHLHQRLLHPIVCTLNIGENRGEFISS